MGIVHIFYNIFWDFSKVNCIISICLNSISDVYIRCELNFRCVYFRCETLLSISRNYLEFWNDTLDNLSPHHPKLCSYPMHLTQTHIHNSMSRAFFVMYFQITIQIFSLAEPTDSKAFIGVVKYPQIQLRNIIGIAVNPP